MEVKYYIIIGGIIIGFLILVFGLLILKKMKSDEKNESSVDGTDVSVPLEDKDVPADVSVDDSVDSVLNENVQLDNSSLDSEIVSKPSVETEEDFLQKNSEPGIEPVKVNSLPEDTIKSEKTDETESDDKIENLF